MSPLIKSDYTLLVCLQLLATPLYAMSYQKMMPPSKQCKAPPGVKPCLD